MDFISLVEQNMHSTYAAVGAEKESEKGRVAPTKVHRYRAGKAPEWSIDARNDADQVVPKGTSRETSSIAAPVIVKKADDPRLARLAQRHGDQDDGLERRREIRAAEVVVQRGRGRHEEDEDQEADTMQNNRGRYASSMGQAEDNDVEEEDRRRSAVREKLLQQQREADRLAVEEEEESEYETDSEEESHQLLKPVFVPKQARDTIAEREAMKKEEEEKEEREKKRLEERKIETQKLVRETVALEDLTNKLAAGPIMQANDIDTDDEKEDDREAYILWKERELGRMKRDKDENDKIEHEAQEKRGLKI